MMTNRRPPRDVSAPLSAGIAWAVALLLGLLTLVGCGSRLVQGRDYWIDQRTRTITTRSEQVAQNICMARGADYGPYLARNALTGVAPGSGVSVNVDSWGTDAFGCYDERDDVIVCAQDNPACLQHERGHREGTVSHD